MRVAIAALPRYGLYCSFFIKMKGGLIAIDNVLWGGSVIDSENQDGDTIAIRKFNEFVSKDSRVSISMIPVGDGLTLAVVV